MRVYKSIIIHTRIYFRFEDGAFVPSSHTHHREVVHGYFTKWNWNSFHCPVKRLIHSVPRPEP